MCQRTRGVGPQVLVTASLPSSRGEKPARATHDREQGPQTGGLHSTNAPYAPMWHDPRRFPGGTGQRGVQASGRKARTEKPSESTPTAAWLCTSPLRWVSAGALPSELRGSYTWVLLKATDLNDWDLFGCPAEASDGHGPVAHVAGMG